MNFSADLGRKTMSNSYHPDYDDWWSLQSNRHLLLERTEAVKGEIFIQFPTRPDLTQGHFVAVYHERIEIHVWTSQKMLIPSAFLIFATSQAPNDEFSPAKQVLLGVVKDEQSHNYFTIISEQIGSKINDNSSARL